MYFLKDAETNEDIELPYPLLSMEAARRFAAQHKKETGRHTVIWETRLVWSTLCLGDLIDKGHI